MSSKVHARNDSIERHYAWVSWIGWFLYAQVVLAVGMFFAVGMALPNGGWGSGLLNTKLFITLFITIPITAVVYLTSAILFLYSKAVDHGDNKTAMKATVIISLAVMAYCVWWVARSFI